jgi:phenylpyruvate tautomerase PptA (4-oxalocrotonate tautomerase family)
MPILDIERVLPDGEEAVPAGLAAVLADATGRVFGSAPGRTWVRLRALPASAYAENGTTLSSDALPVFVTVLLAQPPKGDALAAQVRALADAVAQALHIEATRVHVQLAPPGMGRQAFGGTLMQ